MSLLVIYFNLINVVRGPSSGMLSDVELVFMICHTSTLVVQRRRLASLSHSRRER